jgi:hypothetical protein
MYSCVSIIITNNFTAAVNKTSKLSIAAPISADGSLYDDAVTDRDLVEEMNDVVICHSNAT